MKFHTRHQWQSQKPAFMKFAKVVPFHVKILFSKATPSQLIECRLKSITKS